MRSAVSIASDPEPEKKMCGSTPSVSAATRAAKRIAGGVAVLKKPL